MNKHNIKKLYEDQQGFEICPANFIFLYIDKISTFWPEQWFSPVIK